MFVPWKCAAALIGLVVLGTACSSSGSSSTGPGGPTSGGPPSLPVTAPSIGLTPPPITGASGAGDTCRITASEVSDIVGSTYEGTEAVGGTCTFLSADGAITIISGPISGDEQTTVDGLVSQFTDLEPIPGEDHAYAAESTGQVWLVTEDEVILVGSSTLDAATAVALAKAYAG